VGQDWDVNDPDLIKRYWRQYQLSLSDAVADREAADTLFQVWEEVNEAAQFGRAGVVELLVALAEAAPDDLALATLGAGPIEDLITSHAEEFVDELDDAARRSSPFRTALRNVWYDESVDASIRGRLQRFGTPL